MAEIEQEVKTFRVHYICDECGKGEMLPTGVMLASNPPQYPHECTKCDATTRFTDKKYPTLFTRQVT